MVTNDWCFNLVRLVKIVKGPRRSTPGFFSPLDETINLGLLSFEMGHKTSNQQSNQTFVTWGYG